MLHRWEGADTCIIIDPGEEAGKIYEKVLEKYKKVEAILLTHGHFDHLVAVEQLKEKFHAKLFAPEQEKELLADYEKNCTLQGYGKAMILVPDELLRDGQIVTWAGMDFHVIHTPGHTIGRSCYFMEKEELLFSGDTLFRQSMTDSLAALLKLPEGVIVYPGHGMRTTIGYEKANNPYK